MYDRHQPPESICIMRLSAIGDVCHMIPVIRTLQSFWPQSKITWIIGKTEANLVSDIENIRFIIFDKSEGLTAYKKLYKKLSGEKFDLLLHMQEALRASIATLLIKAKVKLGFNKEDAQDHQWLFCNQQIDYKPRQHYMDRLLQFTEHFELIPPVIEWNIPIPAADSMKVSQLLSNSLQNNKPIIVISPSSSVRKRNYRNWTANGYAEVADIAQQKLGFNVVFTGGPSEQEKEFGKEICQLMKSKANNLIGNLSLKQLLALISRSSAVISPDSGPAHMATTVNVPAISLFYSSNPKFTGPYYSQEWIVNQYPAAVKKFYNKRIEEVSWGKRVRAPSAVELITVQDVTAKLEKLGKSVV